MTERRDLDEDGGGWRAIAGWFVAAAALRFLFLGRFSLWGDEIYSLDDALRLFTPEMTAGKLGFPLFYLLERAVLELAGLASRHPDPAALQWALRLVPALAGAAAAAAAFACPRGFLGRRERHLFAALIAFSPWLLFFSQNARAYTLLVALSIPATFELLRATRDGSVRRGLAGAAWLLLATLVHPTALLLLCGFAAAAIAVALLRVRPLHRGLLPLLAVPLLLAIPVAIWPATTQPLRNRWTIHDAGVEGATSLLLGIGWNVGPVIAAIAFLGLPSLCRRDRLLALHVVVGVGAPVAVLLVLAILGKSVDQRYLIALLPLAFVPAATFARELGDLAARAGAPRLAVPLLVLLPWAPSVVSESIDGNRHDLAGAAALVRAQLRPGDGVIADWHALMRRYLPADFPDELLLEAPPDGTPAEWSQYARMFEGCPRLWIVIPAEFDSINVVHRSFQQWAWSEGRLVKELWRPRLDYHQNRLRVFLLEPKGRPRWHSKWRSD